LVEAGVIPGPRIFTSGMGFHPLALPPVDAEEQRDLVAVFSSLARERVAAGADWIKIFATTGSADDLSGEQIFHYPEIKAATDIAHAAGLRVALHAYGPAAVADALRAKVDSIEHSVGVDEEMLKRWANTDTFYVPTIDHNRYYADHRDEYGYDEDVAAELRGFVAENVASLTKARAAGIRVAMGSDAVMTMFGQNTRELEWFVEAGMTPAQALQAATMGGAALLGQAHFLGRLKVGYAADIVALQGDPLMDVKAVTRRVKWVMKGGSVVHTAGQSAD
jgi:imidazolonepropionase-like amidohydrolase